MPQHKQQAKYTYEGPVYIRPIGRGIVLLSEGKLSTGEYLSNVLNWQFGTGDFNMKITFEVLPQKESKINET